MCGITGIFAFNLVGKFNKMHVTAATMALSSRGPDFQDVYFDEWTGLGHRRLSIIDTSTAGNQPMWDQTKRFCIVLNGEIFNYRELRRELESAGQTFFSGSDTEVLLYLIIRQGEKALCKLNGFFSFCIYDKAEQSFFIARDRYGIKPLLYLFDEDKFIFSSEMKGMIEYGIEKTIDYTSLNIYLQLNYIPAPSTIFKNVKKLLPGHFLKVTSKKMVDEKWYDIPFSRKKAEDNPQPYTVAKARFISLLEESVKKRLVADVPLGAFLSGGVDSSVITGIAKRHKPDLHTFSIGFRDEKFFDETHYAKKVAKHFNTDHTIFSLGNEDLFAHVHDILKHLDEPFADSSAINVYILSKETRKHATVALSGDGADELLGGYNKHSAFLRLVHNGWQAKIAERALPLLHALPQSRNNFVSNKIRQIVRFAEGAKMTPRERYWRWAGYADEIQAGKLLSEPSLKLIDENDHQIRKETLLRNIPEDYQLNDILFTDMQMVLPDDMLAKVDLMSMAHGLEVRVPFLDHELVNYVFSLPSHYKINHSMRKKILQDAFRDLLPAELYNRPKKGFEVPMLKWLRKELKPMITEDLLSEKTIEEQQIFHYPEIEKIKKRLFSANPGDIHARVWGLIVFQSWWKRYMKN